MFRTVCSTTASPTLAIRIVFLLAFFLFTLSEASAADKTDLVVMNNGDRFVGEIKELGFGQLKFKASYMAASVDLDWTRVSQLESTRRFRVEFTDGILRTGSITKSATATPGADFEVTDASGATTRGAFQVVSIEPIEGSFLGRFRGTADVGLTLQPQVGQTQWTGNASIEFPAESFRVSTQVSTFFSQQEGAEDSVRDSFGLTYYQFLSRKGFLIGMTQLLKDNQLNLDLRSTFSGGAGRFLIHRNRNGLAIFGGIAATTEKYFDTTTNNNGTNAEILTGMDFYWVRFASSQIKTTLLGYAGITQWGRYRVDWESSISWEVWNDVYWKTSVLENYDSRPPEGAPHNDFTLTSSFGISF
jgi:hypothetical protein